jgi:hypothetical protein
VAARRQAALGHGVQYAFTLHHDGRPLLSGQAVVALDER